MEDIRKKMRNMKDKGKSSRIKWKKKKIQVIEIKVKLIFEMLWSASKGIVTVFLTNPEKLEVLNRGTSGVQERMV